MLNLSKDCKVVRVMNEVAAGTSEQKSAVVDTSGYDGVMFLVLLGVVTDTSVITATAFENTASSTSSPAPVTSGVAASLVGATSSNGVLIVDVCQPQLEFVYLDITRTTANCEINGVIAILYEQHKQPTVQDATVLAAAFGAGV